MDDTFNLGSEKGGRKRMWLRQHRAEVLDYLRENGVTSTLARFHMSYLTLEALATGDPASELLRTIKGLVPENPTLNAATLALDEAERARLVAERARQTAADLRKEIRELKADFALFQETIAAQLAAELTRALMHTLTVPAGLEHKGRNPLAINALLEGANGQDHISPRSHKRLGCVTSGSEPGGAPADGALLSQPR